MKSYGLGMSLPVYVTRPHGADKVTASYSMTLWMTLLAMSLVWANVVAWGAIGLYEAGKLVLS